MEVKVTVTRVLDVLSGTKQDGKKWEKHQFVGETHDQFPKKMLFGYFKKESNQIKDPNVGDEIVVSFDVESKSNISNTNGKEYWHTDLNVWKIAPNNDPNDVIGPGINQPQSSAPAPVSTMESHQPVSTPIYPSQQGFAEPMPTGNDDLPF